MSQTLTQHLQSIPTQTPYTAATQHPFLVAAGTGKLSKDLLSLYLSQDRLYAAHAGGRFVGQLAAAVPFSSLDKLNSEREQFNQRIIRLLAYCLQSCVRESHFFFVEVAEKYGLDLDGWHERKATRDYMDAMAAAGSLGTLEDGLVFLWANERVRVDEMSICRSTLISFESRCISTRGPMSRRSWLRPRRRVLQLRPSVHF